MRLVRCRRKLHNFWLVRKVSFISMVLRPTESSIVLSDLFLNFLLNDVKLAYPLTRAIAICPYIVLGVAVRRLLRLR